MTRIIFVRIIFAGESDGTYYEGAVSSNAIIGLDCLFLVCSFFAFICIVIVLLLLLCRILYCNRGLQTPISFIYRAYLLTHELN